MKKTDEKIGLNQIENVVEEVKESELFTRSFFLSELSLPKEHISESIRTLKETARRLRSNNLLDLDMKSLLPSASLPEPKAQELESNKNEAESDLGSWLLRTQRKAYDNFMLDICKTPDVKQDAPREILLSSSDYPLITQIGRPYLGSSQRHSFKNSKDYTSTRKGMTFLPVNQTPVTPENIKAIIDKSGGFFTEDALKTLPNLVAKRYILENPECIEALKHGFLQLSNFKNRNFGYLYQLTRPEFIAILKTGLIKPDELMQIDHPSFFINLTFYPQLLKGLEEQLFTFQDLIILGASKFSVIADIAFMQLLRDRIFSVDDLKKLGIGGLSSMTSSIIDALREGLFTMSDLAGKGAFFISNLSNQSCLLALRDGGITMEEICNKTHEEFMNFIQEPVRFEYLPF